MNKTIKYNNNFPLSVGKRGTFATHALRLENNPCDAKSIMLVAENAQGKDSAIITLPKQNRSELAEALLERLSDKEQEAFAKDLLSKLGYHCVVLWHQDDIISNAHDWVEGEITPEEAKAILKKVESEHDASLGITWDTLRQQTETTLVP